MTEEVNFSVIDIETYYDDQYSLKKMTTEEYIRDPRFKIHCIAVYQKYNKFIFTDNFKENLEPFMDGFVIAQHAQFDGLILSHHLNLYPKWWGDTLSMSRQQLQFLNSHSLSSLCKYYGLEEKIIDYTAFKGKLYLDRPTMKMLSEGCLHDAKLTYQIAEKLLENIPDNSLELIDLTIRMFTEPCLELDCYRLSKELQKVKNEKEALIEKLGVTKEDLQSTKKFVELLKLQGCEIPMKVSPRTGKEIPALAKTDDGMKELLYNENETIATLAAARLGQKSTLMETRCERLIGMYQRGKNLPVYLRYHGAHTGRWSGGDKVNFQNFPRGSELRKSIVAPNGYKLIVVDSSQIECRLLNWFCKQDDVLDAFRTGRDLYCENATKFFERLITKKEKDERQFGKVIELASGYGCGANKFKLISKQQVGRVISPVEAEKAIFIYRDGHKNVVNMWRCLNEALHYMSEGKQKEFVINCVTILGNKIIMPDGSYLDYTGIRREDREFRIGDTKLYGGKITENIIQKLALKVIEHAIIKIKEKYDYKLATTTHDEVMYVVPMSDTNALDNIIKEFRIPPEWCSDLPLDAEGFEGERYLK